MISYNPGYQSVLKDLKESTKQRFGAIDFGYPAADVETEDRCPRGRHRSSAARTLVEIGSARAICNGHGLDEGASTRMLIHAGRLVGQRRADRGGVSDAALVLPITDDPDMREALKDAIAACI